MAGEQYGQEPKAVDFAGDTVRAAEAMSDDELDQAIEALGARERRCLVSGKVEDAKSIAYDKWVCISVRARRGQR